MRPYIQNYGMAQIYTNKNNKKYTSETKWKGVYDGNIAKLDVYTNDNREKNHFNIEMTNTDLLDILNMAHIDEPIEKRLHNDFLVDHKSPFVLKNLINYNSNANKNTIKNVKRRVQKKNNGKNGKDNKNHTKKKTNKSNLLKIE